MNIQQLRIVRETMLRRFNLTEVGKALNTSQSGVSKHIKDFEDELGVELYVRRGKRLLALTEPGQEVAAIAQRVLVELANIKLVGERYRNEEIGVLTIATTHTQARYALPDVIAGFKQRYPGVHLRLHQAGPAEIVQMLLDGEADIGIATEALGGVDELAAFRYHSWHHALVVPLDHPLASRQQLTLADIVAFPIITYHAGYTGRDRLDQAFAAAALQPEVAMSALDADVIKTYVALGHGVGLIAEIAFDPLRDTHLARRDCAHLFAANHTLIAIRRGRLLRQYAAHFIELCAPHLTESTLQEALQGERAAGS